MWKIDTFIFEYNYGGKFKSTLDNLRTLVYWIQDYSILFSQINP